MAVLYLLALVLLADFACPAPQPPRIVGGNATTIQEFPSIVQVEFVDLISRVWYQACAGSVLNSLYVLSAGHCFFGNDQVSIDTRIRAGTTYRNTGGVVVGIHSMIVHPDLGANPPSFNADIALVRLQTNLQFSDSIQPTPIIAPDFDIPEGRPVVYAGWGSIYEDGPPADVLQQVTVPIVNREICNDIYVTNVFPNVTENMICTGYLGVGGKDACQGDSGGPLYFQGILIGVVSFGNGCARPDFPGIATRVASYTNWILANAV